MSIGGRPIGRVQRSSISDYPSDLAEFAALVDVPDGASPVRWSIGGGPDSSDQVSQHEQPRHNRLCGFVPLSPEFFASALPQGQLVGAGGGDQRQQ
ncbi:hypothetical protein [Pengzhenrongella phosphoraccumulans]|uniref:hypothetical protein n=1 Tax=Pengzhenrongella phosphoraccumulans TaxID=3114394 RepID=UPI0038900706